MRSATGRAAAVALALAFAVPTADAESLLERARALHLEGTLTAADAAYVALLASPTEALVDRATAANNLCVLRTGQGTYREAEPVCEQAVLLARERLAAATDDADGDARTRLARALNNRGLLLHHRGDPAAAEAAFREAFALHTALGNPAAAAVTQANLGLALTAAGRYREALAAHQAAANLAARGDDPEGAAIEAAISQLNQGVVFERIGAYRQALEALRAADADRLDVEQRVALAVNTAVVLRNLGDPVTAEATLAAAEAQLGHSDLALLANLWLNRGLVAEHGLADALAAERFYRRSLDGAEASGDASGRIRAAYELARLRLAAGASAEAAALLAGALERARRTEEPEGELSALTGLAAVARADGDLATATAHLDAALAIIEQLRSRVDPGPLRWGFYGDRRTVWAAAVDVAAARHRVEPAAGHGTHAFAYAERARARELLDALPAATAAQLAPRDATAVAALLAPGEVLLELFASEDQLHVFTLTRDGLAPPIAHPLAALTAAAERTHRAAAAGREPAAEDLALLAGLLPAIPDLGPDGAHDTVLVVADGPLRRLPFEILPLPGDPEGRLLVDVATVVYLPSASVLAASREAPAIPRPERRLLAVAASTEAEGNDPAAAGLPTLAATGEEIAAVSRSLGGPAKVLADGEATEQALRIALTEGALVVHVAAHTAIDERPGGGAAIQLAASTDHDGLLTPAELLTVPLSTRLVVLSGCRTALADTVEGRALESLTGALLANGAPTVVASLWDVGDAASAVFMTQLYHQLGRGRSVAAALRAAKQVLRADPRWNRPQLWAAFVAIGRPETTVAPSGWQRWWPPALAAIGAAVCAYALRSRGRRAGASARRDA